MKVLTIWQPWATLIMAGVKPYEFRGWRAHSSIIGQRIGIHAGARPIKMKELDDLLRRMKISGEAPSTGLKPEAKEILEKWYDERGRNLPQSAILGSVVLGEPKQAWEIMREFGVKPNDSDRHEHSNWAWPMLDIQHFEPIVPCRGAQGFWNWSGQ